MNLNLEDQELNYLLAILAERPLKESIGLYHKITWQKAQQEQQAKYQEQQAQNPVAARTLNGANDAIATGSPSGGNDPRVVSPRVEAEVAPPDHSDSHGKPAKRPPR
jgi:hypothetical protein